VSESPQERAIALRQAGMSLRQIAAELGVSAGVVHKWTVSAHGSAPTDGAQSGNAHPLAVGRERPVSARERERSQRERSRNVHGDPVEHVLGLLKGVRHLGPNQWEARCPSHEDRKSSLSVSRGDDGRVLLHCHATCSTMEVTRALGIGLNELFPPNAVPKSFFGSQSSIVATYDYRDVNETLLFQVVRFEPKSFRQRRPDGNGGWSWNLGDTPRVLYRLPELAAADPAEWVFVVEGEKDVESIRSLELVATCNPGGAGKWSRLADDSHLAGRRAAILPDAGDVGSDHATDVARRLLGRATEVRIVPVPEGFKDVTEWIEARDSLAPDELRAALLTSVEAAPAITRATLPAPVRAVAAEADDGQDDAPEDAHAPVELGSRDPATGRLVLSPRRTLPTAQTFVDEAYSHPHGRTLQSYAGMLLGWRENRYLEVEDESLCQLLQPWLHNSLRYVMSRRSGEPELVDFESNPGTIKSALDSIRTLVHLPSTLSPPTWIGDATGVPPAGELLPCRSTVLHLPTLTRLDPSPKLFVTNALEFDYDPDAAAPQLWLEFLGQVFPNDPASINLLQSWFGYCLTADTSQQKMMLLVGAKRSGKGTIARILARLIGSGNICGPTTSGLAGPFGLQPLIGKILAVVSDARFAGDNIAAVVERLLCISGEDTLTIDRKYLGSVTMKLPTRFMFLTNELPRLSETSGALAGRFVILRFTQSFFGREDLSLTEKLVPELPGILKWAVEGWHNLRREGRFVEPESGRAASEALEDLLSPIGAFVRECCQVGLVLRCDLKGLYDAWRQWCSDNGRDHPGTVQSFSRDLQAAVPHAKTRRSNITGRFIEGVQLA